MRSFNVLRNSSYALGAFALTSLLSIVVRKYFTVYLSVELLGVEGLFSNIVAMLSLAELGISSIVSYSLYRELAANNRKEINILMNIYRYIYTIIGLFVLVISVSLFPFLSYIVKDTSLSWFYVQFVYVIQIGTILSSYFLAYRRTLLVADQKDYICIRIDMFSNICTNVLRLLAIIWLHSYVIYSILGLIFNIVANLIITKQVKKQYSFIHNTKVTLQEIKNRKFLTDVKNILVQKIAGFIYGGADAIFLSSLLGIRVTGLFANYQLIDKGIFSIMYKALQGVVPSIGSLIHEGNSAKTLQIFWMLDFFYLIFAGYISAIYAILFQPFMKLFFGNEFLLPESVILMMSLNVFTMVQFENMCNFRGAVGMFEKDRNMIVLSALVKFPIAILAIRFLGVTGLILASWLGWFFIGYGRLRIVFDYIIKEQNKIEYLLKHLRWSLVEVLVIFVLYLLLNYINFYDNYLQLVLSSMLLFMFLTIANVTIFYRTEEFKTLYRYGNQIICAVRIKLKG